MSLLKLGCNSGIWSSVIDDVPGNTGVRSYRDTVNDIPTVWPGVTGSQHTMVSLRPYPDDLLSGSLDTQILNLLAVATPGAYLTIYHEAGNLYGCHGDGTQDTNPVTNPDWYWLTPTKVRQMHVKMQNLVNQSGADVRYGCCIYGTIEQMDPWIPYAPYALDWYGIDIYDNNSSNNGSNFRTSWPDGTIDQAKVNAYLDEWKALASGRSGLSNPEICVLESNSPIVANRGPFFKAVTKWLYDNSGTRLYTFFKDGGQSGGPWLDPPDGQSTIDGLNYIVTNYCNPVGLVRRVGCMLGYGQTGDLTPSQFIAIVGSGRYGASHHFFGGSVPVSLSAAGEQLASEAGVRRAWVDFNLTHYGVNGTYGAGGTPAAGAVTDRNKLDTFIASCQAGGLDVRIKLWHEPYSRFNGLATQALNNLDYTNSMGYYGFTLRKYGLPVVFNPSNYSCNHHWAKTIGNASAPGLGYAACAAGYIDEVYSDFYVNEGNSDSTPAGSGIQGTLDAAEALADHFELPFGLLEAGFAPATAVKHWNEADVVVWADYVQNFLSDRYASGKPLCDILFWGTNDNATQAGMYLPTNWSAHSIAVYRSISDTYDSGAYASGSQHLGSVSLGIHAYLTASGKRTRFGHANLAIRALLAAAAGGHPLKQGAAALHITAGLSPSGTKLSPLTITNETVLPGGVQETAYTLQLVTSGGYGTKSWSISDGDLPDGLILNSSGQITGTPTLTGTYLFTVRVVDTFNDVQTPFMLGITGSTTISTEMLFGVASVRTGWRYIAQRILTGEWLDRLGSGLSDVQMTWDMSTDQFLATVSPEQRQLISPVDGRPLYDEWSTAIYAVEEQQIRGGYLLVSSDFTGLDWQLTGIGFRGYINGQIYNDTYSVESGDPLNTVRAFWTWLQDHPNADIGLAVEDTHCPVRIGRPTFTTDGNLTYNAIAKQFNLTLHQLHQLNQDLMGPMSATVDGTHKPRKGAVLTVSFQNYTLNWWDAPDLGQEIQNLSGSTPFEQYESHAWADNTQEDVAHTLHLGYPRIGTRKEALRFVEGENITELVDTQRDGTKYANELLGVGAGNGRKSARVFIGSPDLKHSRLRRTAAITNSTLKSEAQLMPLARKVLASVNTVLEGAISSCTWVNHSNAPLGSFQQGDDILVTIRSGWLAGQQIWHRIVSYTYAPATRSGTLNLARSDSFLYISNTDISGTAQ